VHVRWLTLRAFRNHASLSFTPDPGLNVLTGPNGQGKTSLLEAAHVLLTGRSFRTSRVADCVAWGAAQAHVAGEVEHAEQRRALRVALAAGGGVDVQGGPCPWARAVSFTAGDLELLAGGPQVRRAYVDGAAVRLVPGHADTCRRYRLVLYQRGRLLGGLAGRGDLERLLAPWDEQVVTLGADIVHRRLDTLEALGGDMQEIWRIVAPQEAPMAVAYAPAVPVGGDAAGTRERLAAALRAARRAELRRGVTLAGPHRDDLVVRLGPVDARTFASRGQQRLLALTLRLAEAAAVRRRLGTTAVLLLDDLLSELDREARERVTAWLGAQGGQAIFSTTDAVPGSAGAVWDVRGGDVAALETMVAGGAA
jgi:DNA replication and repair protein RecF